VREKCRCGSTELAEVSRAELAEVKVPIPIFQQAARLIVLKRVVLKRPMWNHGRASGMIHDWRLPRPASKATDAP
jgi:hypothetical protein